MEFQVKDKYKAIKILEKVLSAKATFSGPPAFAYQIGEYCIDRSGNVTGPTEGLDEIRLLLIGNVTETAKKESSEISIPDQAMRADTLRNLINMLHSKQFLINKALGREAFMIPEVLVRDVSDKGLEAKQIIEAVKRHKPKGIMAKKDNLVITGFPGGDCFKQLSDAILESASKQKHVLPDLTIEENEKYYMRAWLVRIGLKGNNGKAVRKVMLRNLNGHTAFRTPDEAEKWKQKYRSK
jgi:hypothetical protein